jgi:hypothetical protein
MLEQQLTNLTTRIAAAFFKILRSLPQQNSTQSILSTEPPCVIQIFDSSTNDYASLSQSHHQ